MADEPENDVLELKADDEIVDDPGEEEADEEEVVSFGDDDEGAAPPETDLVKHLRKENRKVQQELATLRRAAPVEQPITVGDRPTLEGCEYDDDRFAQETDAWIERRDRQREQERQGEQQKRSQEEAWTKVTTAHASAKAKLTYPDKEEAEATAFEALSPTQQAVIAKVATDPALFIYAAGKNINSLNRLAAIDDPLVLAAEIGRMGAQLKSGKRARAPEPEQIVRGGTVKNVAPGKRLAKLEEEADRTGDRSKVIAFKRAQKDAGK